MLLSAPIQQLRFLAVLWKEAKLLDEMTAESRCIMVTALSGRFSHVEFLAGCEQGQGMLHALLNDPLLRAHAVALVKIPLNAA